MTGSPVVVVLIAGVMISLGVMAASLVIMMLEARRTLRRINDALPHYDQAAQEARRTLAEARQLIARTNHATRQVETVVHKATSAAIGVLDSLLGIKNRAEAFLVERLGNGAGLGPGAHHRRHNHHRRV